ncbi:hypothetical protein [Vallitalea okinawensis]|uniref:hypothetical protein n=1 Tax=Vallitalea okinawensis TaxID=2078660 RepID=UPI000CFB6E85|nr:hypothetical protein [Vallitalea okinawensis]
MEKGDSINSIIIITEKEISKEEFLENSFKEKLVKYQVNKDRIYLEFKVGYVWIDCNSNLVDEYNEDELGLIMYDELHFYIVSYNSRKALTIILEAFQSYREAIIDDDHGFIGQLSDYMRK